MLFILSFSEPQFPSIDKRLRIRIFPHTFYLLMLPLNKINTNNKSASAAVQGRITLISEAGSPVFEPAASRVISGQQEGLSESLQRKWRAWGEGEPGVCSEQIWRGADWAAACCSVFGAWGSAHLPALKLAWHFVLPSIWFSR